MAAKARSYSHQLLLLVKYFKDLSRRDWVYFDDLLGFLVEKFHGNVMVQKEIDEENPNQKDYMDEARYGLS